LTRRSEAGRTVTCTGRDVPPRIRATCASFRARIFSSVAFRVSMTGGSLQPTCQARTGAGCAAEPGCAFVIGVGDAICRPGCRESSARGPQVRNYSSKSSKTLEIRWPATLEQKLF
jgi:hypothetical protein